MTYYVSQATYGHAFWFEDEIAGQTAGIPSFLGVEIFEDRPADKLWSQKVTSPREQEMLGNYFLR